MPKRSRCCITSFSSAKPRPRTPSSFRSRCFGYIGAADSCCRIHSVRMCVCVCMPYQIRNPVRLTHPSYGTFCARPRPHMPQLQGHHGIYRPCDSYVDEIDSIYTCARSKHACMHECHACAHTQTQFSSFEMCEPRPR